MDGALTFIHICVDSSQSVLENYKNHRSDPYMIIQMVYKFPYTCVHVSSTTNPMETQEYITV